MNIILSFIKWLFIDSIYGMALLAAGVYLFSSFIKKKIPKSPDPLALATITFLIALLTLPSISRLQFEKESLSSIEGKNWIRVINKTQWGSLTEPLTWFHAPIGSIYMVMPNSSIEGGFREVLLRYEEQPYVTMSDPDCSDKTISYSEPDDKGVFRYASTGKKMSEKEIEVYCHYDWSKEKEALVLSLQ